MAYTDSDYLIRTIMTSVTGLVEDQVINDFAVQFIGVGDPEFIDLEHAMNCVGNFFTGGAAAVNKVGNYISRYVDRAATHEITATKIVAGPMGSPDHSIPWLGPPAPVVTDSCPEEVAGVLSFHADLFGIAEEAGATHPRARRRGRVYIGPLSLQGTDYDAVPVRLGSNLRIAMQARAVAMADELEAYDWRWCVWSRADQILRPVVGGWTDNAPDTQRRRGPKSTARTTFGPVGP